MDRQTTFPATDGFTGDDDGLDGADDFLARDHQRGIFTLASPDGGRLRFDPAEVNARLDEAEAETGKYNDLMEVVREQASALRDGLPVDEGLAAERRQVQAKLARLGYAAFDKKPLREDQANGWTRAEAIAALTRFIAWEIERQAAPVATS
jgi:hypothetical protein